MARACALECRLCGAPGFEGEKRAWALLAENRSPARHDMGVKYKRHLHTHTSWREFVRTYALVRGLLGLQIGTAVRLDAPRSRLVNILTDALAQTHPHRFFPTTDWQGCRGCADAVC